MSDMPYRVLGRTGEKVSAIGLGGWHLSLKHVDAKLATAIMQGALDGGINFFDNSWDYNDGESEKRMGEFLADGRRKDVFLMTKIDGRTYEEATKQLEESLKRLKTDCIDLVQHHEIIRFEDPHRIFQVDGANAALLDAQRAGKLRYIGFTGHKDPLIHLHMLEVAEAHNFVFDAAQMPLNVMDAHYRSFARIVVPELQKHNTAVLGMKSMADRLILQSNTVTPTECLHYALNLPTSVVITGMDSLDILNQALNAARTFQPLDEQQLNGLLAKTREAAMTGKYELFKTSSVFDGTAENPKWLGTEPARILAAKQD
jgi:aryl-alcohol dehydrogenase-like predicted oxidoreductase